MRKKNYL